MERSLLGTGVGMPVIINDGGGHAGDHKRWLFLGD